MGTIIDPVTLTLEIAWFFENFNIGINFWTVDARALVFHKSILSMGIMNSFDYVTLTLEFDLPFKKR